MGKRKKAVTKKKPAAGGAGGSAPLAKAAPATQLLTDLAVRLLAWRGEGEKDRRDCVTGEEKWNDRWEQGKARGG